MRRREWISASAGLAAILVSVFVLGGATRWSQALIAGCVVIGLVPILWSRGAHARSAPVLTLLTVIAVVTALQLVPLPTAVLEQLQPTGQTLRSDGAELARVTPWSAVTLDAPTTLNALCFVIILIGLATISLRIAATERGRYKLLATVALVCAAVSVVVAIHELLGAKTLYGIYEPAEARPSVLGPLLNENHLGCLMGIGAMVASGLAMYHRQSTRWRVAWVGIAVACATTAVASQSRGATLALIGGAVITGAVAIAQRAASETSLYGRQRWRTSLPIAAVALSAIVVIIYAGAGGAAEDLGRTRWAEIESPRSKFAIWESTAELVMESPWVGIGRGAFEPVFTRVHPAASVHSFSHVENEYLQALVDWGLFSCVLIGIAALLALIAMIRRWRQGPLVAGALGATALVMMQSFVDFGIELLGVAAPMTVLFAAITFTPLTEAPRRARRLARARIGVLVALLIGTIVALLSDGTRTVAEDHRWLANQSSPSPRVLREVIERHPLDYYPYALAARAHMAEHRPEAIQFLNHALRLHPSHPALHHLAARMLHRAGQLDQASIEYSLAVSWSDEPGRLIREIASAFEARQGAKAIPVSQANVDEVMRTLVGTKRTELANEWLRRVLEARPADLKACGWLTRAVVQDSDISAAELASRHCTGATSHADRVALARFLLAHARPAEALSLVRDVERWSTRIDVKKTGWLIACDAHLALRDWEHARRCLRYLDATGLADPASIRSKLQALETVVREATTP